MAHIFPHNTYLCTSYKFRDFYNCLIGWKVIEKSTCTSIHTYQSYGPKTVIIGAVSLDGLALPSTNLKAYVRLDLN